MCMCAVHEEEPLPEFATQEEAGYWMDEQLDGEDCIDNERFAFADDETAMGEYESRRDNGCCGYFDSEIIVAGRKAMIGCNYGH